MKKIEITKVSKQDTVTMVQFDKNEREVRTYSWTSKGVKGYVYKRAKRTGVKRI